MRQPGGACHVHPAVDRGDPGGAGERPHDPGRAEDRDAALDPGRPFQVRRASSSPPGTETVTWNPDPRPCAAATSASAAAIIRRGTGLIAGSPGGIGRPGFVTVPTPSPPARNSTTRLEALRGVAAPLLRAARGRPGRRRPRLGGRGHRHAEPGAGRGAAGRPAGRRARRRGVRARSRCPAGGCCGRARPSAIRLTLDLASRPPRAVVDGSSALGAPAVHPARRGAGAAGRTPARPGWTPARCRRRSTATASTW